MSIVKILDDVTNWAHENICKEIELKMPPRNSDPNDYAYEYRTVHPVAFTMYVPTEDKLPKHIPTPFPSLCVRFVTGEDDLAKMQGALGIQFLLSAWNPGTYGPDKLAMQNGDPFRWGTDTGNEKSFERNGDGWRDIWNFTDIAVKAIESTTNIAGYEIDRSVPVKFGPLTEQEAVPDYYPFWFTWVSFQLNYPLLRNIENTHEFL